MRYLILADIHSNTEALDTIQSAVKRKRFDKVLVLGDLVGYGASPNPVVNRIRAMKNAITVRGNHDKVASGVEQGDHFNEAAKAAAFWTRDTLSPRNLNFLQNLPKGPVEVQPRVLICHGAPHAEDAYMFSDFDAMVAFKSLDFDLCFFGHSHYPSIFKLKNDHITLIAPREVDELALKLEPGTRYLVNPGSVGQPRDRDPRTCYAIYDTRSKTIRFYRRPYPVEKTMKKIFQANLPEVLGNRLQYGT